MIVTFDGKPIKESRDLPRLVGQTAVGKTVDVVIVRKGKEQTVRVTLGRLDETEKQAKAGEPAQPEQPVVKKILGLDLVTLNEEARKRLSIKDSVKGVLIAKVDPNSPAAEKRLSAGDVIVEVQQEAVATPEAVSKRIDALKKDGKKSVLLLVANPQGDVRFVALSLD